MSIRLTWSISVQVRREAELDVDGQPVEIGRIVVVNTARKIAVAYVD